MIYNILGTPTVEKWPGIVDMPWYELVKPKGAIRNRFRDLFHK
jgi:CTD kinase subunit alpha